MIIIESSDGSHTATLTPSPDGDGVWVVIKRVIPPLRTLGGWFLRGPLHASRDKVHDIVYPLTIEGEMRLTYDNDLRRVVLTRQLKTIIPRKE